MLIEDGGQEFAKTFVVAAIAEPPVYLNFYAPCMVPSAVLEKLCVNNQTYHWSIQTEPGQLKAAEAQLRQMAQGNQFLRLRTFRRRACGTCRAFRLHLRPYVICSFLSWAESVL